MRRYTTIEFSAAEVLNEQADGMLLCLVGSTRVAISRRLVEAHSTLQRPGDRGRLVLPKVIALQLGLSRQPS